MRIRVQRVHRGQLPWVAMVVFVVWAALVAVAFAASRAGHDVPPLCNFRRVTGHECPTCGGTRAAFALARLDPLAALRFNPLVTVLLVAVPAYLALRTATGRGVAIDWTRRGRAAAWAAFAVLLALNWAWVLWRG